MCNNHRTGNTLQEGTCKFALSRWNFLANLEKSGTLRSSSCKDVDKKQKEVENSDTVPSQTVIKHVILFMCWQTSSNIMWTTRDYWTPCSVKGRSATLFICKITLVSRFHNIEALKVLTQGLKGEFWDPGFDQNMVQDLGKWKIYWQETGFDAWFFCLRSCTF